MSQPLRIGLVGPRGKMGVFIQKILAAEADLDLVCLVDRGDDARAKLRDARVAVGLDVTRAGLGAQHGLAMLAAGVRPLIGTSGVTSDEIGQLDRAAREAGLGGLVVPNFSLGIWLQQKLALEAARYLDKVEVIEEHHATKVDAPSATAIDTAARLVAAGAEGVEIHSVRLPGLYSNQTVLLGGTGEVLRIAHETYGLEAFGPGILAGLRYAAQATGVASGIEPAFEHAAS